MVATHSSTEALQRRKAITAEINRIPLRDVMENLFGFRGKKGGPNMLKYEISPGFHLNCSIADNWFASFNGAPIPGLGGNGRKPTGSSGAIDAVIAVRSILGGRCDFKEARAELQRTFLPQTLDDGYVPDGASPQVPRRLPPQAEIETPKELPARFNTAGEYLRSTRANREEPVIGLPDNLEEHVHRYLTSARGIPEAFVDGLMARNGAYPSVRQRRLVSRRTGRPYCLAEPMVVFPLSSWRENFIIGYDYKTLPTEPSYASFAASEGRKKFGGYQVGRWDKNTRHVILTEAALDGISKWVLERPSDDTCIWGMSGARTSDILIAECRQRGIDVRVAFDADRAGRIAAAATLRQCREFGVPCECEFVDPSEIDFELTDDRDARSRLQTLAALCQELGRPFRFDEAEAGVCRGVVANHGAVLDLLGRYSDDDQLDRLTASAAGEFTPANEPRVRYAIRNKDWNDVLKGDFHPKLVWGTAPAPDLRPSRPAAAEPEP